MSNSIGEPCLPWDLWLHILEEVERLRFPSWASCAAVCKAWQAFIEPRNFNQLRLTAPCSPDVIGMPCLDELSAMVIRQRSLVKHIDLVIMLPEYDCPCCSTLDPSVQEERHNTLARTAVEKLFAVLSLWEPSKELVLELNAFSPSDTVYVYKHHLRGIRSQEELNKKKVHRDTVKQEFHGPSEPTPTSDARIHSRLCWELGRLAHVHAVTSLVIPRELRRLISAKTLHSVVRHLPRLQNFIYEPWRRSDDRGAQDLLDWIVGFGIHLPQSVKALTIFENAIIEPAPSSFMDNSANFTSLRTNLARLLFLTSLRLQHLSVHGMIEGASFFRWWQKHPSAWAGQLRNLTLTTGYLRRSFQQNGMLSLLRIAREAVLRMPVLERLVLWSCAPGEASAFIFERRRLFRMSKVVISITWRATWTLPLSRGSLESWRDLAAGCLFRVEEERITEKITCRGDAIRCLRLAEVADSKTLWQLEKEGLVDRELEVRDVDLD